MANSSPICIDANLVVQLLVNPEERPIRRQMGRWRESGRQLVAPTLLRYEVTNAFHRLARAGVISNALAQTALQTALHLPIEWHDQATLHASALDFANRFGLPAAYDAHYLALAERLGAEFWTADQRLANSVRPQLSWVYLIGK